MSTDLVTLFRRNRKPSGLDRLHAAINRLERRRLFKRAPTPINWHLLRLGGAIRRVK